MGVGGKGKKSGNKGAKMVRQTNQKVKGTGKKGGNGKGGKVPQEKRIDPSDGNGPFSYASFIKYHGEKKGDTLWKKAGSGEAVSKNEVKGTKAQKTKGSAKGSAKARVNSTKGVGKTGKKGKGGKGRSKVEKRIDPTDGNGPYPRESFIRFHGEEKGAELWDQAEGLQDAEEVLEDAANDDLDLELEAGLGDMNEEE